ncbi:MAG: ABC transporter permease subunit [Stackebrandtia sp.]
MKLLSVELRRFASRRANVLFAALGLLFLAGALVVLGFNSHSPTASELATAQQEAEEQREQVREDRDRCENEDTYSDYRGAIDCDEMYNPSQVQASDFLDGVVSFADEAEGQIVFLGIVFVVCALLMSGSFVGAEWSSGGMTNLLLWNPRRLPVFAAKLTAAMVSIVGLTLAAAVLHLGGLYVIALTNGDVGTVDADWWEYNGTIALRFLVMVAVAVIWGVSLSMIGRRTVVAIGSVLAYLVVFEFGLRALMDTVQAFTVDYVLLSTYAAAWFIGSVPIHARTMYDGYNDQPDIIYRWEGGGVILAVTAILLAGSAVLFSRRDTT